MSFKNNYSKLLLLANKNIDFEDERGRKFKIIPPTLIKIYSNDDLIFVLGLLQKEEKEIQSLISNFEINNIYDFIHLTFSLSEGNEDFKLLAKQILNGLKLIIPNIYFDKTLKIDKIVVTSKLFEQIKDIILMSLGKKVTRIEDEDDEFTRIQKEAKIRAERIRHKGKDLTKKGARNTSLEDIIAAILYEFPQYKIIDIMNMNLATIYYLFNYVGKIANYEVGKIAMGNGLSKKFKYFIDK